MNVVVWGMLGGAGAVLLEYIYLTTSVSWLALLWAIIPLQLIVSRSIYGIVKADNILAVPIFFSFGTAFLRIVVTTQSGGATTPGTLIGFGLVLLAVAIKIGEKLWIK